VPHGSPRSPVYPRTRSNSNLDPVIDELQFSSHPLHEEGIRPRSGSNRDTTTSFASHSHSTTTAVSSLYTTTLREPVIVEHSESVFDREGRTRSGLGSALALGGSAGSNLDSSSHALLASMHEKEPCSSSSGGALSVVGIGQIASMVDAAYDYDYDSDDSYTGGRSTSTGDGRNGDYSDSDSDGDDNDYGDGDSGEYVSYGDGDVELAEHKKGRESTGRATAGRVSKGPHSRGRDRDRRELAANYSALPTTGRHGNDSTAAAAAAAAADAFVPKTAQTATVKYVAWACMLLAILSGAAIGPAFKVMESFNIPPLLAASWRCQCMSFVLLPLAWLEAHCKGPTRQPIGWLSIPPPPEHGSPHAGSGSKQEQPAKYRLVTYMLLAGAGWGVNLLAWVSALKYTTTVRASIFAGLHPLFLVMYYGCRGQVVSQTEWLGVLVACTGITLTIFDETPEQLVESQDARHLEWLGLFLCVCAAVAEVLILVCRSVVSTNVPTMMYTFCTTVEVALISAIMCLVTGQATDIGFGDTGLLGWLTAKWAAKMFVFGFVVGVICVAGFNFAMTHISALVFSACLLVDPAVTGVISYMIKLEHWPGPYTVSGGAIVVCGVGCIMLGEHHRQKLEKAAAADSDMRKHRKQRRLQQKEVRRRRNLTELPCNL